MKNKKSNKELAEEIIDQNDRLKWMVGSCKCGQTRYHHLPEQQKECGFNLEDVALKRIPIPLDISPERPRIQGYVETEGLGIPKRIKL